MKFRQRQVADPAAQENFEQLQKLLANSLAVRNAGDHKVAWGTSSATWTAAILSAAVTIAHGLGVAPGYVNIQTQSQLFEFRVTGDATNLTVTGYRTDNTAQSGTVNFYWIALA